MIDVRSVLRAIDEPDAYGGNPDHWDDAMAAMPAVIPFLDRAAVAGRVAAAGLAPDRAEMLATMADVVARDEALTVWAFYLNYRLFVVPERGIAWGAPSMEKRLGARSGLFFLLLSLEFAPRLRAYHAKLGYPEEVTAETMQQIAIYEGNHLRGKGVPGMYEGQFLWLSSYLVQPFVRLGRFEYQLHAYGGGVAVWQRPTDDAVLALADDATRVDGKGLLVRRGAPRDVGWTTRLAETDSDVTGFPVDPRGHVLQTEVRLSKTEWRCRLKGGDTVLDLHIPAGGSMDWGSMASSLRRAIAFFGRHHAGTPFKALVVTTWFMDPRLADLVPADSNPLKLQRAVYLYPTGPDPESLWFVFLRPVSETPPASLPEDTSLQRTLKTFLEKGGLWHGGGFFMLPEDMAAPTENRYRDSFDAVSAELGIAAGRS